MIDLQPQKCNICGGNVSLITNDKIYGKKYGSGFAYLCLDCGAYVGTHEPRPTEAVGILANEEMRSWKKRCHSIFDSFWEELPTGKLRHAKRNALYHKLAAEMEIPFEECHFGYFDMEQLKKAFRIIQGWLVQSALANQTV